MSEDYLPLEFEALRGKIHYVQRHGFDEYTSSCPQCGGAPHANGELPDRFCMWLVSKTTGGPFGWCRKCGYKWWPGKEDDREPTEEEKAKWAQQREIFLKEQEEIREKKKEYLRQEHLIERYHENLTDEAHWLYEDRGIIPEFWVDYWQLGYCPAKEFWYQDIPFEARTLTIPIFDLQHEPVNIKHRLLNNTNFGKYRYELSRMPDSPFYCNYEKETINQLIVVEGEFKAMVVFLCLDDVHTQVVGLPSKSPSSQTLDEIKLFDVPKWFILDPDAYKVDNDVGVSAVERLESYFLGIYMIDLPNKVDDMIVGGTLNKYLLQRLMETARYVPVA